MLAERGGGAGARAAAHRRARGRTRSARRSCRPAFCRERVLEQAKGGVRRDGELGGEVSGTSRMTATGPTKSDAGRQLHSPHPGEDGVGESRWLSSRRDSVGEIIGEFISASPSPSPPASAAAISSSFASSFGLSSSSLSLIATTLMASASGSAKLSLSAARPCSTGFSEKLMLYYVTCDTLMTRDSDWTAWQ